MWQMVKIFKKVFKIGLTNHKLHGIIHLENETEVISYGKNAKESC